MDVKILLVTFLGILKPSILNTDVIYFKQVARFQNAKTFLLASSILTLKARQSLSKDEFWISSSRTPCCQPDYFHFFYFCSLWIFTPSLNYFLQLQCIFTNKTKKFLTTKGKTSKHTEYSAVCVFVWHPEPCFILTVLKYNNIASINLLYAFYAYRQNFVCT